MNKHSYKFSGLANLSNTVDVAPVEGGVALSVSSKKAKAGTQATGCVCGGGGCGGVSWVRQQQPKQPDGSTRQGRWMQQRKWQSGHWRGHWTQQRL